MPPLPDSRHSESTPLTAAAVNRGDLKTTTRADVWAFLEGRTTWGFRYEVFTVSIIVLNVVAFVYGTIFSQEYNVDENGKYLGPDCSWCDDVFVGENTASGFSILECFTAILFTIDYALRFWACVEDEEYSDRMQFVLSFYSLIDLLSILPFYIDLLTPGDLPATQFFRMFRLFRMMRVEGRYAEAFGLFDDVFAANKHLLLTSSFVGSVVWMLAAGFYYAAERKNPKMIYCPECPDVDVDLCTIDTWGFTDCSIAGCTALCYNLFESIPSSMYFTCVNLFGEYPLADRYSGWGKVVGTLVAVVAVFVFAIPTGIIGNGFGDLLEQKRQNEAAADAPNYGATASASGSGGVPPQPQADQDSFRARAYSFATSFGYEVFTGILVVLSTITFMLQTCDFVENDASLNGLCDVFELVSVIIFTFDYVLRLYSIPEDPEYGGDRGRLSYALSFFAIVDFLSVAPFWIGAVASGSIDGGASSVWLRALRLLRLFKAERYMRVFGVFRDVIIAQSDALTVTGFIALVFWVFFSSVMYFTERGNPDADMAKYYKTIPASMWVTLLALSGEVPLCFFTVSGKIVAVIIGIFAVGLCGIPIGVLGAGFQDWVAENGGDTPDESLAQTEEEEGTGALADFIEGRTANGKMFNSLVLLLIFVTIIIAIIGTTPQFACTATDAAGACDAFEIIEFGAAFVFTLEYSLRFLAAPHKLSFLFSFYSLIDLLAIVPTLLALVFDGGWFDDNNSTFLLLRVLRLFKLDKYAPSITLIDDVFRLKRVALFVAGVVAFILWIIFATLLYLAEYDDTSNEIDRIPEQGCTTGTCTEADRFTSVPAALPFTLIHLTGDYPIIEYTWGACIVCGMMVVVGAGLVAIPSALIADGFAQVVEDSAGGPASAEGSYERQLRRLKNVPPPRETDNETIDQLQTSVNTLLNGTETEEGDVVRTPVSRLFRNTLLALILINVVSVIWESVPKASKDASLASFNSFECIELVAVVFFTTEYLLRIFSVVKDKNHLYSRWFYATTFFGVVDLLSILPFYVQLVLSANGVKNDNVAACFRIVRLFRLLELEHFVEAFSVLDNVFRRSSGVFLASGLMALAIWVSAASLFYLFERDNPNWCTEWQDASCAAEYTPLCTCAEQIGFGTMPDSLFFVAVFLGGEWAVVDFTIPGKLLCMALCLVGIAIYAVPVGTFFDAFGKVLEGGLDALDEEDEDGAGKANES